MNNLPWVSVLITSYNREKFISKSIESVINSTFQDIEIIILDDASTDNTYCKAEEYSKNDRRIKLYRNTRNIGQFANRNLIVNYASGKYLMYLDSDDTIESDAIDYLISSFINSPEVGFGSITRWKDIKAPTVISSVDIIQRHFYSASLLHFGPSATIISKELFERIGGFPEIYGPASDMYYNIKAASNSAVLLFPYEYLNYGIHDGQALNDEYGYLYNGYLYFKDILDLPEIPLSVSQRRFLFKKAKRRFVINCLRYLLRTGNFSKAYKSINLVKFGIKDFYDAIFC